MRSSVRGYIASLRAPLEKAQLAFTLEKARTEKYRAQKLALEIAAKGGKLVEREAMLKGIVEGLVAFKRRLSAVPTRVSGAFASSAQERRRLEELLEKEVNDTLEVLVSILEAGDGEQGTRETVRKLLAEAASAIRPVPKVDIVAWCEAYRWLSPEASNEPGPWRLSRSPYVAEIMRACLDPDVPEVVIMGGSQVAKSEVMLNLIAYRTINDPAPSLLLTDNLITARTLSEDRLQPMFRDSPILSGLVKLDKGPAAESSTFKFVYPSGSIHLVGSNSSSGVSSRPIRFLYVDELDKCAAETNSKIGDPIGLARHRLSTYPNRKILMVSSPTIAGLSRIESAFLNSSQEYWWLPCPRCGEYQRLSWKRLSYESAELACEICAGESGQAAWLRGAGSGGPRQPNT